MAQYSGYNDVTSITALIPMQSLLGVNLNTNCIACGSLNRSKVHSSVIVKCLLYFTDNFIFSENGAIIVVY